MSAGALSWLGGQTHIFFCCLQPVHVQFEWLSLHVELREWLVNLGGHWIQSLHTDEAGDVQSTSRVSGIVYNEKLICWYANITFSELRWAAVCCKWGSPWSLWSKAAKFKSSSSDCWKNEQKQSLLIRHNWTTLNHWRE